MFTRAAPLLIVLAMGCSETELTSVAAGIVGTGQSACYDHGGEMDCPNPGELYFGQDAQGDSVTPSYRSGADGTVVDNNTGLIWQWEQLNGVAFDDAEDVCASVRLADRKDWRVPTTKELYSLILFSGTTGSAGPESSGVPDDAVPYLDDGAFDFAYGDVDAGERFIDTQFISSTIYVSEVFADNDGVEPGQEAFFGVNYADGRIKGYPTQMGTWQLRCVAGEEGYGDGQYEDLGDDTVADAATGLMWTREDSGHARAGTAGDGTLDWGEALAWCEDLVVGGHDDWRLPDAKELQALVDYERSPDTSGSAAIDPVFDATEIVAEDDSDNFGWYWTSTTHLDGRVMGAAAVYVAFGEALGQTDLPGQPDSMLDVHGAGSQRSDPKVGARSDYPQLGMGPQGDVQRVYNLARCVRTQ